MIRITTNLNAEVVEIGDPERRGENIHKSDEGGQRNVGRPYIRNRGNKSTMPKTPSVGVGVIVEKNGQVLLLKRKNVHGAGSWSTPGGHLEYGESPEECAIREAKEETSVNIGDVDFRAITNDLFEASEKHYVTIWMEGRHLSGEPVVSASHEASDVGWFAWNALPKPLFLSFRNLLEGRCYPPSQANPAAVSQVGSNLDH